MTTTLIEFDTPPSTGSMMLRAAFSRKPGLKEGEDLARFEATVNGVTVAQLADYQSICGFPESDIVPITMPQIVAAPLHMAVLTHPSFPMPAMGMVHVSSRITQERPIRSDEVLDVLVWIEGQRQARKGCEADLMTEVRIGGVKVWESVTTVLSMAAKGHGQKSEAPPVPSPDPTRSAVWTMPSDLGRRYGTIAGDRNPIHLWPITAKLFGFKRHIIHGMWLLARAMSELDADIGEGRVQVDVSFKRPVFLPGKATFNAGSHEGGIAFRLDNPEKGKTHLFGTVQSLS
jgi:acyl dehydratase